MVYRGHIENGAVVIDEPTVLADGTAVEIHVVAAAEPRERSGLRPWLEFSGIMKDLPPDASMKIDEVLYGRPPE